MAYMGSLAIKFATAVAPAGFLPSASRWPCLCCGDAPCLAQAEDAGPTTPPTPEPKVARPGLWDALAFSGLVPRASTGHHGGLHVRARHRGMPQRLGRYHHWCRSSGSCAARSSCRPVGWRRKKTRALVGICMLMLNRIQRGVRS